MPTEAQSTTPVLISLSAFGASEVRRHGQFWFSELSLEAGADGVEVRSELLTDPGRELPAIARALQAAGKSAVYSSAEGLWNTEGALDLQALERAVAATQALGSARLKMAIGGFHRTSHASLVALQQRLSASKIELLIENDQTPQAGTLGVLQDFFDATDAQGISLGMTFDIGNWHWMGECPFQAAAALDTRVHYVHCKGVQRLPKAWVAVPLADSSAPWRAVLSSLPNDVPWAIEYPLQGEDLLNVTRQEIAQLRQIAASMVPRHALKGATP